MVSVMSASTVPSGVIETVLHRLVSRRARVGEVEPVGGVFRLVTLVGDDLRDRRWTPGDMIQIGFAGLTSRAYTPLSYDPVAGAVAFLGHVHGHGIGSSWLASATVGEPLFLVGPRSALDLDAMTRPLLFFGDETSLSTAAALRATPEGLRGVTLWFEVDAPGPSRLALERMGVTDPVTLAGREPDDRHLDHLERELVRALAAAPQTRCVFTGKASSIQRLYRAARRAGHPSRLVTNLAYWAPGRRGFSGVQR
jgi:ferric-chelate reductase (NADPH)